MSVADNISFETFCQLCNKVAAAPHDKKKGILENFIENWKSKAEELKKDNPNLVSDFFFSNRQNNSENNVQLIFFFRFRIAAFILF